MMHILITYILITYLIHFMKILSNARANSEFFHFINSSIFLMNSFPQ